MNDNEDAKRTKLTDALGNTLSIDDMVLFTGDMKTWIGKVSKYDPGGMSIVQGPGKPKETLARLEVLFSVTVQVPPGQRFIPDLIRIVSPRNEAIIEEMMKKPLQ